VTAALFVKSKALLAACSHRVNWNTLDSTEGTRQMATSLPAFGVLCLAKVFSLADADAEGLQPMVVTPQLKAIRSFVCVTPPPDRPATTRNTFFEKQCHPKAWQEEDTFATIHSRQ